MAARGLTATLYGVSAETLDNLKVLSLIPGITSLNAAYPYSRAVSFAIVSVVFEDTIITEQTIMQGIALTNCIITSVSVVSNG